MDKNETVKQHINSKPSNSSVHLMKSDGKDDFCYITDADDYFVENRRVHFSRSNDFNNAQE